MAHWLVNRLPSALLIFCSFAITALAQPPLLYNRSIYNSASYMPAGIPAGAIARGSIFSLFGERLGPAQAAIANAFPLGSTLGGVSITVIQGGSSVSAIPLYVGAAQINAIMPSNAPLGAASIQVVVGNFRSNMLPVRIANSAFGIFTALGTGLGPGILQNFVAADNQPINSPVIPAQNGQVITLWGTGLGPVTGGDNVAPKAGNLPVQVDVFVGGVPATVLYSGRTPCCAGTDQIVFQVPANAPTGCWVPVYVRTGGATVSNFVSMAIGPPGSACATDVFPQIGNVIVNGGTFGKAILARATTRQDVGVRTAIDVTADYHASFGFESNPSPFPFNPAVSLVPSGTCTVYTMPGDLLGGDSLPGILPATMPLDFGPPLSLTGPNGTRTLTSIFTGARGGYLGGSITNGILPSSLFLDPGSYSLKGFGGTDVGAFSTDLTIPQPVAWTNRNQLTVLNRAQPLNIAWTGGDSGQVILIVGVGEDLPTNSTALFACIAPSGATSFTISPDVLSNLPPTRGNPLQSKDVIYLMTVPGGSVQNLNAKGLDAGLAAFYSINGKTVVLQ